MKNLIDNTITKIQDMLHLPTTTCNFLDPESLNELKSILNTDITSFSVADEDNLCIYVNAQEITKDCRGYNITSIIATEMYKAYLAINRGLTYEEPDNNMALYLDNLTIEINAFAAMILINTFDLKPLDAVHETSKFFPDAGKDSLEGKILMDGIEQRLIKTEELIKKWNLN